MNTEEPIVVDADDRAKVKSLIKDLKPGGRIKIKNKGGYVLTVGIPSPEPIGDYLYWKTISDPKMFLYEAYRSTNNQYLRECRIELRGHMRPFLNQLRSSIERGINGHPQFWPPGLD